MTLWLTYRPFGQNWTRFGLFLAQRARLRWRKAYGRDSLAYRAVHLGLQAVADVLRFPQPQSEIAVLIQAHVLAQQVDGLDQRAMLDQRAQRTLKGQAADTVPNSGRSLASIWETISPTLRP